MTRILVDTSVWIDHFKHHNHSLVNLLLQDAVITHPMIIGEIFCGTPPDRANLITYLLALEQAHGARLPDILDFVAEHKLYGCGCGLIDITLLLSALITPNVKLWTFDRRLQQQANRFGVSWTSSVH